MIVALLLALATEVSAPAPSAPAPATTPATAAQQTTTAVAPAKADGAGEMVCKSETVTGSRFPKKVCRRKADVEQQRQEDQERIRETQRMGSAFTRQ